MNKYFPRICTIAVTLALSGVAHSATITPIYLDSAGIGFNDATLGAQRKLVAEAAINQYALALKSDVPIRVGLKFSALPCTTDLFALAFTPSADPFYNFTNAPMVNTLYPQALANAYAGEDLNTFRDDMTITVNSDFVSGGSCAAGAGATSFYLGLDGDVPEGQVSFYWLMLHEIANGLGWKTMISTGNGASARLDLYDPNSQMIYDITAGKFLSELNDSERLVSSVNSGNLIWFGDKVNFIADSYQSGTLEFQGDTFFKIFANSAGSDPLNTFSSFDLDPAFHPNEVMVPALYGNLNELPKLGTANTDLKQTLNFLEDIGWKLIGPDIDAEGHYVNPPSQYANEKDSGAYMERGETGSFGFALTNSGSELSNIGLSVTSSLDGLTFNLNDILLNGSPINELSTIPAGASSISNVGVIVPSDMQLSCDQFVDINLSIADNANFQQTYTTRMPLGEFNHVAGEVEFQAPDLLIPEGANADSEATAAISTLSINAPNAVVTDEFNVHVNIEHANIGNLYVVLESPIGTRVELLRPSSLSNYANLDASFPSDMSPYQSLNAILGQNLHGNWRLLIWDLTTGVTGNLVSWGITDYELLGCDFDNDTILDESDPDIDGDGVANESDLFAFDKNDWADFDNDGMGDNADLDDDNDGFTDEEELLAGSDPKDDQSTPETVNQSSTRYDQNGDGKADIIWRSDTSGQNWFYGMNGHLIDQSKAINVVNAPWRMIGRGDFNGDGKGDMLWRNDTTGQNYMYLMNGSAITAAKAINTVPVGAGWDIISIGDYNGDGNDDMIWRNANTGVIWQYQMNGFAIISSKQVAIVNDANWKVVGSPDLNGDGKDDILLRNDASGIVWKYIMNGHIISSSQQLMVAGTDWQLVITGDFDGDDDADLLWRNTVDGRNYVYLLDAGVINWNTRGQISQFSDQNWTAVMAGDFDGDGDDDIFWRHMCNGQNYMYLMNGTTQVGHVVNTVADLTWNPVK